MSVHKNRLAWAAAGIFAVGAVSGWSAPQLLQAAQANDPVTSVASSAVPPAPIGPMTAPNYRAIVAQNQAAVVGVSIEGHECLVAADARSGTAVWLRSTRRSG